MIFLANYVVVAIGRLPGFRVDRTGATLIGAALMVGCGVLTLEDAYKAIDLDTLTLLLGMMIVVANLRLSGFFRMVNAWAVRRAHHPMVLLTAIVLSTGVLSAFLVNDAICLVMAPIVIELTRALKRNPVPYLIAVALASNVGSTATITGNPQNMIIGTISHIPYGTFAAALAPVAALGLLVTIVMVALFFIGQPVFFIGQPVAKVAIVAGGVLLLTRRIRPQKVYEEIDGQLLLMFAGLFVVVAGLEHSVLTKDVVAAAGQLHLDKTLVLSGVTAVLSNLVSNVPAVLILKPFLEPLVDPQRAWLVVAWPPHWPATSRCSVRSRT